MQYALVDNIRKQATKNSHGVCPTCGAEVIAKCGQRVIHHWAHKHIMNCDPWWENETQWHRDWKNLFPEDCREVNHTAPNGEIHRADIITRTGIVIEVQNSPMSDNERESRENFYQNMIWIINGEKFKNNFYIYHSLPDPTLEIAKDLVWIKAKKGMYATNNGLYWRKSKNPEAIEGEMNLVEMESLNENSEELKQSPSNYFQYDWIKPRRTWLDAKCPVFIDLGDGLLALLENYPAQKDLSCIRLISKQKLLYETNLFSNATEVAKNTSPTRK